MQQKRPPEISALAGQLKKVLDVAVRKGVFPGAAAGVSLGAGSNRVREMAVAGFDSLTPGKKTITSGTSFDLASLTKPLATTLAVLCLLKEKRISLTQQLPVLLPAYPVPPDKAGITLLHLLSHCSGLPAYRPYYKQLMDLPAEKRKKNLVSMILQEDLQHEPGKKACYSDLDFMLLGAIIERITGQSLDDFADTKVYRPLGMASHLFFQPLDKKREDKHYAATENCPWRGKVLQGEVHDDNAWSLGGVAGHAGLFGDIDGVLTICTGLLDQYQGRSEHKNYSSADLRTMVIRPRPNDCWALGFDTPSLQGSSSGRYFSDKSFGHLGFTGTSFWIDPVKELVVVLLTNRVHPERSNDRIKKFRPFFHDSVMELLHLV